MSTMFEISSLSHYCDVRKYGISLEERLAAFNAMDQDTLTDVICAPEYEGYRRELPKFLRWYFGDYKCTSTTSL